MDSVSYLVEDDEWDDESRSDDDEAGDSDYDFLEHDHTRDQLENFQLVHGWRQLLDEHSREDGVTRWARTTSRGGVSASATGEMVDRRSTGCWRWCCRARLHVLTGRRAGHGGRELSFEKRWTCGPQSCALGPHPVYETESRRPRAPQALTTGKLPPAQVTLANDTPAHSLPTGTTHQRSTLGKMTNPSARPFHWTTPATRLGKLPCFPL
ncbi:Maltase 2 [Gryllus bimaculatus]|nr:Maltase 2 [Gryllus bimaculatus]